MKHIRVADLEFVESPGSNRSAAVATRSKGAKDVSVVRQCQAPGGLNPAHRHDREEVLVMISGVLIVTVGESEHSLGAGDAMILPADTIHILSNRGTADAEWYLVAPAGIRYVHENGEEAFPVWAQ